MSKNCLFFKKLPLAIFFLKRQFLAIKKKKVKFLAIFWQSNVTNSWPSSRPPSWSRDLLEWGNKRRCAAPSGGSILPVAAGSSRHQWTGSQSYPVEGSQFSVEFGKYNIGQITDIHVPLKIKYLNMFSKCFSDINLNNIYVIKTTFSMYVCKL